MHIAFKIQKSSERVWHVDYIFPATFIYIERESERERGRETGRERQTVKHTDRYRQREKH